MGKNSGKQIRLSEEGLRKFISYAVTRLLKEGYGREIYGTNGKFYGYEDSKYGRDTMNVEVGSNISDEFEDMFINVLSSHGINDEDAVERIFDLFPVTVIVSYDVTKGRKSGDYMLPDDPDEVSVIGWEIERYPEGISQEEEKIIDDVVEEYMDTMFDLKEELIDRNLL